MAHLRSLKVTCDATGCEKQATQRLFSWRNTELGHYCSRHAQVRLRDQKAYEDAEYARERGER